MAVEIFREIVREIVDQRNQPANELLRSAGERLRLNYGISLHLEIQKSLQIINVC